MMKVSDRVAKNEQDIDQMKADIIRLQEKEKYTASQMKQYWQQLIALIPVVADLKKNQDEKEREIRSLVLKSTIGAAIGVIMTYLVTNALK